MSQKDEKIESRVVCCNTELIRTLKSPALAHALSLLATKEVISGLEALKEGGIVKRSNEVVTEQASDTKQSNQEMLSPTAIKQEPESGKHGFVGKEGREVSMADFDNIASPKRGKKRPVDLVKSPAHSKKSKPVPVASTLENMLLLTELKRKAIKECDLALKIVRPQSDKDRVIYHSVIALGRKIVFGPERPLAFYKMICNLFPDIASIPDNKKVQQLLVRLASFIAQNIMWTQVHTNQFFSQL